MAANTTFPMGDTVSLRDFTRSQFGLDADDGNSPHPRQHRQWWETHTAIIVLLILAMLGAFAATGLSAGYGYTILKNLNKCCHDIKTALAENKSLIETLTAIVDACCTALTNLINDFRAETANNFNTVIANEEIIIDLLESLPTTAWKCTTGYALPGANCTELTQSMLPLTVPLAMSGACYVLQTDLTWTSASPSAYAINWYGSGGALYGCGHTLSSTQPTGRAVRIVGNISNTPSLYGNHGELDIYDMAFNGPSEFYNNDNWGVYSYNGARTRLFNVKTTNWHFGAIGVSATLEEYNCNHTVFVDVASEYRASSWLAGSWNGQHTGAYCQSGACKFKNSVATESIKTLPGGVINYTLVPFYDYFAGFQGDYNTGDEPLVMSIEGCSATGTEPFWIDRAGRGSVLNSNAKIVPGYPPADLAYPNSIQYQYGVRLGSDVATNIIVDGLEVDAREINEWSGFVHALWLVGTEGQLIKNVNVYGHMPITNLMSQSYPYARRNGLITIDPDYETRSYEPAQLINVNVKADDTETIGVAVYLSADTDTHGLFRCHGARSTIRIDGSTFVGGAAGIAVGSEQRHLLSVSNSLFQGSYYGIYAFNTSANLVFKNNEFAHMCTGIQLESGVGNTIVRDNNFVGNNYDLQDNGGAAVEFGSLSAGTLYQSCNTTAAPDIWDTSLLLPCGVGPAVDSIPHRGRLALE